eukprot:TRINITY_DN3091_c0_g1_i2.p1 TRINITY_DN3091_c0_g1~~TRINITY_DN3091_c0_g1_i2.p1  ORF type:complete len:319 (-),score=68.58 TRINITY_DN3091_c0_g1_i2:256-1212(-)
MASLVLLKQTALAHEKYSKNGVQKEVHIVVKNAAFTAICQLVDIAGNAMPLAGYLIDATLLYDCEEGKEVDFVKMKPMEYKSQCNEKEDQYQFEIRLKVLSSQLEDMFFRIRFNLVDLATKTPIPGLSVVSDPIKVISKPDQIKKKPNKAKKRPATPALPADANLAEALLRIEQQQIEQQKLLKKLVKQSHQMEAATTTVTTTQSPSPSSFDAETSSEPNTFETAFSSLLSYYRTLAPEERPVKIRKLIRITPSKEINDLSEMLDIFCAEGLQKELRQTTTSQTVECSVAECPHKKELERIDDFYRDFLSSALDYPPF